MWMDGGGEYRNICYFSNGIKLKALEQYPSQLLHFPVWTLGLKRRRSDGTNCKDSHVSGENCSGNVHHHCLKEAVVMTQGAQLTGIKSERRGNKDQLFSAHSRLAYKCRRNVKVHRNKQGGNNYQKIGVRTSQR